MKWLHCRHHPQHRHCMLQIMDMFFVQIVCYNHYLNTCLHHYQKQFFLHQQLRMIKQQDQIRFLIHHLRVRCRLTISSSSRFSDNYRREKTSITTTKMRSFFSINRIYIGGRFSNWQVFLCRKWKWISALSRFMYSYRLRSRSFYL